jgi:CDP-6-deoxy-D-xylo-4-hexulose-3-dehydrase
VSLPLASPSWDAAELAAIQRVIESGRFTMGPSVARFEREFADFVGSRHAVMVNSGSSANLLMVAALCFRAARPLVPGDEVIVPAVSWPTTYYPLAQYGLILRFVDIDPGTLNYDLAALRSAIGPRTRMIMAVNLLGNPNDFVALRDIIGERDILLVEDNCESLGAELGGRQAGTFGLIGTFSTFFSHHMSTMEGGLAVTDDEELYHLMLCLRAHGWTRDLPRENRVTGVKGDDPFVESFRFVLPGYNLRPLEMSGAIGSEQLRKLPDFIARRRDNAALFTALFAGDPRFAIQEEIGRSSWFGFALIIRPEAGIERARLTGFLADHGFECRPIVAGNFARSAVAARLPHTIHGELGHADHVDRSGLFVGNHHFDVSTSLRELRAALDRFR